MCRSAALMSSMSWGQLQLIPQFTTPFAEVLPSRIIVDELSSDNLTSNSSGTKINHATPAPTMRRSWRRWRIAALIAICILLNMFLTMESAIAQVVESPDSLIGDKSYGDHSNDCHQLDLLRSKLAPILSKDHSSEKLQSQPRNKVHHGVVLTARISRSKFNKLVPLQSASVVQSHQIQLNLINPRQQLVAAKPPGRWSSSNRHRRFLVGASVCTNKDISIFQSADGSSGIPRYAVQIMNNCMSDCPPSDIHVFCGWFASALLVNPNSFKRIAYNDCLVNGGKPLRHGETLRFTYANSFMYPLRFKSASFCK